MEIHKNFVELLLNEKMQMLKNIDGKFFNYDKFTGDEFYREVKISYLENDEIEELDLFIKEKLRDYPNDFPDISPKATKNFERDKETYNKKLESRAKKALEKNNIPEAVDNLMLKKYTKKIDSEVLDSIEEQEYIEFIEMVFHMLATEDTISLIIKEIILELKEKFSETLFPETIKTLAKLMSYEIYLRTKKPAKYCKKYFDLHISYVNNIQPLKRKKIFNKINRLIGLKSPIKILDTVKRVSWEC